MKNATPLFEAVTELGFPVPLDWSRRSASPKLAELEQSDAIPVSAWMAEQFGLFEVCPLRHVMQYRGAVARHAGTGQWLVNWPDGSFDTVYLGSLLFAANIGFRGFVDARGEAFPGSVLPVPPAPLGESRADGGFSLSLVKPSESGQNHSETSEPSWRPDDNFQDARRSA